MSEKSFADQAGLVVFPRSTADLTSTSICPACFTKLTSTTCSNCGLDVTHPAAITLHDAALTAAAALDQRIELIGQMRAAAAAIPVAAPAAVAAPPVIGAPPAAPAAPAVAPAPVVDAPPRRHFGVQVILLIVGVSLLAIGAIFFLVYAFITFGLVWRSVIIGAVTIAAFVGASLLRRRRLGATAEAIAALAVVFVYLDAFAIRANDLFGAQDADGLVYWGVTLLLSAVGFLVWHRLSGLRLPSVVAFTAAGPGLSLLVAGLAQALPDTTTVLAAFAGLAAGGLIHSLAGSRAPERWISQGLGTIGLLAAGITALFLDPENDWAAAIGLGIVALLALAHVVVVARVGSVRPLGFIAAGVGGVAASLIALVVASKGDYSLVLLVPPIVAVAVALALEFLASRLTGFARSAAVVAGWSAAGVTGLTLVMPVVTALAVVGGRLAAATHRWSIPGGDSPYLGDEPRNSVIGLAIVVALAAVAWLLTGRLASRKPALAWSAFAVIILAVPLLGMLWLVVLAWLLLGALAIVALVITGRRGSRAAVRVPLVVGGAAATALAYFTSWASIDTWWYGSVGTVALLVAARVATKATPLRGILLALATILAFVAIGSEGWHTNERFQGGGGAAVDSTHFVIVLGIVLLVGSALLARVISAFETRVLFWLSFATTLVAGGISWALGAAGIGAGSLVLPEFGTSSVLAAALVVVLVVWRLLPRTAGFGVERVAASIAIAPAAAWLADSLVRTFPLAPFAHEIAPIVSAALVAAVGLAVALLRPTGASRGANDLGVALVAVPTIMVAVTTRQETAWLVLLLGGVTALLLATSKDGLFASASPRKHLGWVALALGVGALWWRLGDSRVTEIEPYTLPLAAALLVIALLVWRANRAQPTAAVPLITLAGLAVGLLPSAVVATNGPLLRALIVAGVGAALLIAGSILSTPKLRYQDAAALAGGLALAITAVGRAAEIASRSNTDLALDAWLGGLFVALAVAAVAQARHRPIAAQLLLGVALAALLIEFAVLDGLLGTIRAVTLLVLYAAIYVVALLVGRAPVTALIGWGAFGLATLTAIVAVSTRAIDPLEWATAALAAALLVVGAVKLRQSTAAGSWSWLAPGILVLLLPSLFATFLDQPFLRLVGLGIACVVAIVVGAIARLQAPLIIGSVVVLVHAIRTFAPQLVAVYQLTEWWVWAVVGGAIILFLGLTFEKRVRDLRAAATRVAALR